VGRLLGVVPAIRNDAALEQIFGRIPSLRGFAEPEIDPRAATLFSAEPDLGANGS
jgi:hypothetical protein